MLLFLRRLPASIGTRRNDEESKRSKDPLTAIQSRLSRPTPPSSKPLASFPTPTSTSTSKDKDPTTKRLSREAAERTRALTLLATHHHRQTSSSSAPSTPAVSVRSASETPVHRGGYESERVYGGDGYGQARFFPRELERVERERRGRKDRR